MSTRSITRIHEMDFEWNADKDEPNPVVCAFYRHADGYPEGHGKDMANWLKGKKLVNGKGSDYTRGRDFNGAGVMAVCLMAHIHSEVTESINTIPTDGNHSEEYDYDIYYRDGRFFLEWEGSVIDCDNFTDASFESDDED